MKRSNRSFLIFTIITVLLCIICLFFILNSNFSGKKAYIYSDGKFYGSYSLSENISCLVIETQYGYNIIEIRDGQIGVIEADCADKTCVNTGFTNNPARPVICMPHRLEIVISEQSSVDGVTG